MKILTGSQIKDADLFTIEHEPIDSLSLMERASEVMSRWICNNVDMGTPLLLFIGKGNNGGDGLAMARMLSNAGFDCSVCMIFGRGELSGDCAANYERLPESVGHYDGGNIAEEVLIIDAILGTGARGEVSERVLEVINNINSLPNRVIAIDLPSGMKTEFGNRPDEIVYAETTLALEFPKLAMLLPEAGECCGNIEILSIELDPQYFELTHADYNYITEDMVRSLVCPRAKFAYKNMYGHALLVCGSEGMAGAAALATGGALRSGCGLVTVHMPKDDRLVVQANHPSAMVSPDGGKTFSTLPKDLGKYDAVGVGCGIGVNIDTVSALGALMSAVECPVVIDADALNIMAQKKEYMAHIPEGSILTPHPGELERIAGGWNGEEKKIEIVKSLASGLKSIVVLKGAHTMVCMPDGTIYFNSTGNNGMAKGGSGDVLTGFITGLMARGYDSESASILGVYLHGVAGDKAADYYGAESMNSGDIMDFLAEAMQEIK